MSRSTRSDIVENVAAIGDLSIIHDWLDLFMNGEPNTGLMNGWQLVEHDLMGGKKQSLFVGVAIKNDKQVFLVNTSEYSNVGDYWYVVFSNDRSTTQEFLNDFGVLDSVIEDMDSICQTL